MSCHAEPNRDASVGKTETPPWGKQASQGAASNPEQPYQSVSHLNGERHVTVVLTYVSLQDVGTRSQHSLEPSTVKLHTLQRPTAHNRRCPRSVQKQCNFPYTAHQQPLTTNNPTENCITPLISISVICLSPISISVI